MSGGEGPTLYGDSWKYQVIHRYISISASFIIVLLGVYDECTDWRVMKK